jgi:hypothetical protein
MRPPVDRTVLFALTLELPLQFLLELPVHAITWCPGRDLNPRRRLERPA